MSKKNKQPELWQCRPKGDRAGFVRVWKSVLSDPAFTRLTNNQRLLYIYMLSQYNGDQTENNPNGKKDQFYFNWALVTKNKLYSNQAQFRKDRDALIAAGFIKCEEHNQNLRKRNVYAFSHEWINKELK